MLRRTAGKTVVMISHNISRFYQQSCGAILCLHRGAVAQRGTHDELMQQADGLYAQLVKSGADDAGGAAADDPAADDDHHHHHHHRRRQDDDNDNRQECI